MSIPDKDPPTYRISSSDDRERILAEVIAHAALREAVYRQPMADPVPPGRWKGPLALVVMGLAAVLAAFPPGWVAPRPPRVTNVERVRGLRAALQIEAQQLEAFRMREGRLPESLEELDVAVDGVEYVRSNNRVFQLVATAPDGNNIVYDSARPSDEFVAVSEGWVREPTGS